MAEFEFRQCEWDECRFRFPTEVDGSKATRCPTCGSATDVVGVPVSQQAGAQSKPVSVSFAALLDNIRSIHNVGSMFRTADGAGVRHLYLGGMTATPAHPKLAKAALGAQEFVPWSYHLNGVDQALALKKEGHELWGIELDEGAEPLFEADLSFSFRSVIIVVGNERAGVDPGILTLCDRKLYLPMAGSKNSLNVAVTFGIISYHLLHAR